MVADLVESIGGVRNKLPKVDLLVRVNGVDDQRQQLRDLSLELKGLGVLRHGFFCESNVSWNKAQFVVVERGPKCGAGIDGGVVDDSRID